MYYYLAETDFPVFHEKGMLWLIYTFYITENSKLKPRRKKKIHSKQQSTKALIVNQRTVAITATHGKVMALQRTASSLNRRYDLDRTLY